MSSNSIAVLSLRSTIIEKEKQNQENTTEEEDRHLRNVFKRW